MLATARERPMMVAPSATTTTLEPMASNGLRCRASIASQLGSQKSVVADGVNGLSISLVTRHVGEDGFAPIAGLCCWQWRSRNRATWRGCCELSDVGFDGGSSVRSPEIVVVFAVSVVFLGLRLTSWNLFFVYRRLSHVAIP